MKLLITTIIAILVFCFFISTPEFVSNKCEILPVPVEIKLGLPWKKIPCDYEGLMWGSSIIEKINAWITQSQSINDKFYTMPAEK